MTRDDEHHSPMQDAIRDHLTRTAPGDTGIAAEHRMVRSLCSELEAIADRLPLLPHEGEVKSLSAALRAGVPAHCRHEESAFRMYMARTSNPPRALVVAVERLASEHSDNEPLGHELADMLEAVVGGRSPTNLEALGYLIRLYFQTMRRHLMWEEFVINSLMDDPRSQSA